MIGSHYFNLSLEQQTFSITESTQKPKKRHSAISTLKKIEKVLREDSIFIHLP